jgi:exodeoxyribonuclease VII small subunit
MPKKEKQIFEKSLSELETIVANLEQGDAPLEEALNSFQKGMALSKELTDTLQRAEETLAKVMSAEGEEVLFEK